MSIQSVPEKSDVVIIGGGPAGSHAATLLAQRNIPVVLLEKVRHPRPTVGESLIPHFWKFTDKTGATEKILAEGYLAKAGGITVWDDRITAFSFGDFGFDRPALHVERDHFDHLMLQHAASQGAEVHEDVSVSRVDFSSDEPVVHYQDMRPESRGAGNITCRYVLDASGNNALLAKQFKARHLIAGKRTFLGMWGHFKNNRYFGADANSYGPEHIGKVKPVTFVSSFKDGWAWHIQLREKTSVGLVINTGEIKGMGKEAQTEFFLKTVHEIPYLCDLLQDAELIPGSMAFRPDYSYYSTKLTGPNFGCIGDAGAFVDPIFSHGVQAAFYAASVAAWAVEASFKRPSRAANYAAMLDSRMRQHYGFSRSLALGDHGGDGVDTDLVVDLMKAMPEVELELMLVASDLSNRSGNFLQMAQQVGIIKNNFQEKILGEKLRVLDTLHI
jgi:flavin-dependent dehydrogenase